MPTKWRSYRDHTLSDIASPYVFPLTSSSWSTGTSSGGEQLSLRHGTTKDLALSPPPTSPAFQTDLRSLAAADVDLEAYCGSELSRGTLLVSASDNDQVDNISIRNSGRAVSGRRCCDDVIVPLLLAMWRPCIVLCSVPRLSCCTCRSKHHRPIRCVNMTASNKGYLSHIDFIRHFVNIRW